MSFYLHRMNMKADTFVARTVTDEVVTVNTRTHRELDGVDTRVDRLSLLCEALWRLVQEETDLTEEDLVRKVAEVDDEDGTRNFRRQRVASPCECGAKIPPARLTCQFCGAPAMARSIFDAV